MNFSTRVLLLAASLIVADVGASSAAGSILRKTAHKSVKEHIKAKVEYKAKAEYSGFSNPIPHVHFPKIRLFNFAPGSNGPGSNADNPKYGALSCDGCGAAFEHLGKYFTDSAEDVGKGIYQDAKWIVGHACELAIEGVCTAGVGALLVVSGVEEVLAGEQAPYAIAEAAGEAALKDFVRDLTENAYIMKLVEGLHELTGLCEAAINGVIVDIVSTATLDPAGAICNAITSCICNTCPFDCKFLPGTTAFNPLIPPNTKREVVWKGRNNGDASCETWCNGNSAKYAAGTKAADSSNYDANGNTPCIPYGGGKNKANYTCDKCKCVTGTAGPGIANLAGVCLPRYT